MKKIPFLGLAAGALIGLAVSAHADTFPYTDIISFHNSTQTLLTAGTSKNTQSGTFDITALSGTRTVDSVTIEGHYFDSGHLYKDQFGFDPTKQTADSGFVSFYFRDNNDNASESYKIDISSIFATGSSTLLNKQTTLIQLGANTDILATLNTDGKLSFVVTATAGNFYLDYARLDVIASSVPDGATTIMLLGGSLCGIGMIRRKLKA